MDLATFCRIVDGGTAGISACEDDLSALYQYVGLSLGGGMTRKAVSDELYKRIKEAFVSGHQSVWQICRKLQNELIQKHVIDGELLEPYFAILGCLRDAIRANGQPSDEVRGDWGDAILLAYDHVRLQNLEMPDDFCERTNSRVFEVSKAAKRLREAGLQLIRNNDDISLEPGSETKLVDAIEGSIKAMGGLNVARRLFTLISPDYDALQERYHVVRRVSQMGGGNPQIPVGYLLHLAAKHLVGIKPLKDTDQNWSHLLGLTVNYAAVLDVQGYTPSIWGFMDAAGVLRHLQELALYDTLFCIPQIRGNDLGKIVWGVLEGMDFDQQYGSGWSINEALIVIGALIDMSDNSRGPIRIEARRVKKICRDLSPEIVSRILDDILSHPMTGANQNFSKPTDAPMPGQNHLGHDLYTRPLLKNGANTYFWLDRSVCSMACLESLLAELRNFHKNFDDLQVGPAIERFMQGEFQKHGIQTSKGVYRINGCDGECDLIVETSKTIIFFEIKKKPLTQKARAGIDANLMIDLTQSLLHAQVQAGWHEVRLRDNGFIDLDDQGVKTRLELKGRGIERIAVSLLDFGGFQDRILLKQFLEGILNARFSVNDPSLKKGFDELNGLLAELGQQVQILNPDKDGNHQPFFHCWFLSVPQLLVLLDGVQDADGFRDALWQPRHTVTGSSDFYFDLSYMKKLHASSTPAV